MPAARDNVFNERFFLHVFPADVRDLPLHRQKHGFDNLDFSRKNQDGTGSVWRRLPGYAIERIVTGQFSADGSGGREILWRGEHVFSPEGGTNAPPSGSGIRFRG